LVEVHTSTHAPCFVTRQNAIAFFCLFSRFACGNENFMGLNGNGQAHEFWTAKEAAAYVRISVETLYGYCRYKPSKKSQHRVNVPPFRRIGRNKLLFPITEFKEWTRRFDMPEQERK
jgi:hypothetical protein